MFQNKNKFLMILKYNAFVLFFVLFNSISFAQSYSVSEIRTTLEKAQNNESVAKKLYLELNENNSSDATVQTLSASATALMALHAGNPFKKLKYAKKAYKKMNTVIQQNPTHLEARLIRFSIQSKAGSILGSSENLNEDISFIEKNFKLSNLQAIPEKSRIDYLEILKESNKFSTIELRAFEDEIK